MDLNLLYSKFDNNCEVISFHGSEDSLVPLNEKRRFGKRIPKCVLKEIYSNDIDGNMIKSAAHGLNADFIELFDYALKISDEHFGVNIATDDIAFQNVKLLTKMNSYEIDYSNRVPVIGLEK